jgi:hypothetical protein
MYVYRCTSNYDRVASQEIHDKLKIPRVKNAFNEPNLPYLIA